MVYIADIHIHLHNMIPQPFLSIYRLFNRKTIPPLFKIQQIPTSDLSLAVVNAVGDKIGTVFYGFNAFNAVKKQIKKIQKQSKAIDAVIYSNPDSIREAKENNRPLILIGVEGGDFLNNRIERVKEIYDLGVRSLVIVHSADNCLGYSTVALTDLFRHEGNLPNKKYGGLSSFGKDVITELNNRGIIVDIAHSCEETAIETLNISDKPVIASHTGALSIQSNFPRYISDEIIKKIAKSNGIIGLWPFYYKAFGIKTREDLIKHLQYISSLVGSKVLALGTDINGLPGIMEDFSYPESLKSLEHDFQEAGISEQEIKGILGENYINFLSKYS